MKKQIGIIAVFLFAVILIAQAGKYFLNSDITGKGSNKPDEHATISTVKPEEVGMRSITLSRIDSIVKAGIKAKVFPGCQVLVLKDGKAVYDKCFGSYTYESLQQVTPSTMYDLASVSKTTGTLLAIMKLYDDGKLQLTDKASMYLPALKFKDKENITIKDLLLHETGLPASLPFYSLAINRSTTASGSAITCDSSAKVKTGSTSLRFKADWVSYEQSGEYNLQVADSFYVHTKFKQAAIQMIANTRLNAKTYLYSCVNFIVLKEIAEIISGMPMNVFLDQAFYSPLKLASMTYLPLLTHKKEEIAPTLKKDFLRYGVLQGYVHDPDAAFFGGVSGNAGLFATAHDVALIHQMLLNNGELNGVRCLKEETCKLFVLTTSASGRRALGFDRAMPANPKHNPCCNIAPAGVYGHTGYTGTCCWVDPKNNMIYVFLSNRTFPMDGENKLAKTGIRSKIQEVIYQSIQ